MTNREKRLIGLVAAAGVLWGGTKGLSNYRTAVDESVDAQLEAEGELSSVQADVNRGYRDRRRLANWRRGSLPTDADVAESLYRDWLTAELAAAGLGSPQVSERARATVGEEATELTFTVTAKGELPRWLDFFKRFNAAPHLHRISEATLTPDEKRKEISGTLRVDALALADCNRDDTLAEKKDSDVASEEDEAAVALITAITDRKPFQPHDGKKDKPEGNGAGEAVVSAMFTGRSGWIVSVRQGKSGKIERYATGDTVKFGSFEATLVELDGRRVVYETDDGRFEVQLGQNFGEGRKLGDEA